MESHDVVVVGSGPNGLAAAITLARAGCSVVVLEANATLGGGTRSAALTEPGFIHDLCSAIHPLALASPFFRGLPLAEFGLEWIQPDIPLAHPLDDGMAVSLHRDLSHTVADLGEDGSAYARLMKPFLPDWDKLLEEFLQPMLHWPRHPLLLARFGLQAVQPATLLAKRFRQKTTRALIAGIAAHSFLPLEAPASSAFALMLGLAGHAVGWPVARGGSQAIADALANYLRQLGGSIETNHRVASLADLPQAKAILLDVTPWQFVGMAGERLPSRYRRRLQNFRHAPGVCKVDYALNAPVPWRAEACKRAGTVHLGGTLEAIAHSENQSVRGDIPERPFVLIAQQSLFDDTRAPRGQHTLWAYAHVPFGCAHDLSNRIDAQIERFAPGFRDCVVARQVKRAVDLENSNPNLIGGDISGGASNLYQLLARPVLSPNPYRTPLRGVYLCSASTPPGAGVHGMCGYHAARAALRDIFGERQSSTPG